jgi:Bifunctional DNA primase/polymerase, N-terminal
VVAALAGQGIVVEETYAGRILGEWRAAHPALSRPRRKGGRCSCPNQACPDPGKHPRLRGWQCLAAADTAVVGKWWRRWPEANLGLATGRRFDVPDVEGAAGVEALRAILFIAPAEHPGPLARTGGGGWHLLYAPPGWGIGFGCCPGWTGGAAVG